MPGTRYGPAGDEAKESRQPQIADDDHHAEEKRDCVEIDDAGDIVDTHPADRQHETCADQRRAGAVEAEAGQAADRDNEVGDRKDLEDRGARRCPGGGLVPSERRRRDQRRHGDDAAHLAASASPAAGSAAANHARRAKPAERRSRRRLDMANPNPSLSGRPLSGRRRSEPTSLRSSRGKPVRPRARHATLFAAWGLTKGRETLFSSLA